MRSTRFRSPACVFAVVALAILGWPALTPASRAETPVAAQADAGTTANVDPAQLFDAVVDTIDRNFVDTELLRTLDWPARAKEVRPSVVSAASLGEAVGLIRKLLAELKLSHNELTTPDELRYYITLDAFSDYAQTDKFIREKFWGSSPYFPGIGIFAAELEGKHFVDGVLEGSPADKAGLKFGDEIVSIDGKPYSPIAAFRGKIGSEAEVAVRRRRDGEVTRYHVPVVPVAPSVAFPDATKASARVVERNGRRIGYVHIWSLKDVRSFRAALASIDPQFAAGAASTKSDTQEKALDALIVDLRGRVGGNSVVAGQMLDSIGTAQKPYWGKARGRMRPDAPPTGAMRSRSAEPPSRPFQGNTALLVNHQTRSAGEIMAFGYKRSLFGWVFGTQTAGSVAGSVAFPMPGGFLLLVAVDRREYDGKALEGTGVAPDVRIEQPLPYAAGADPVLDAALAHLAAGNLPHP